MSENSGGEKKVSSLFYREKKKLTIPKERKIGN